MLLSFVSSCKLVTEGMAAIGPTFFEYGTGSDGAPVFVKKIDESN
jgi:hypothetical protein